MSLDPVMIGRPKGPADRRIGRHEVILVAEDDPDDRDMVRTAFEMLGVENPIRFVDDGLELLNYLQRTGQWQDPAASPRPGVVLLDLNMPRMDGREALGQIRCDPDLRRLPVIVLTTSSDAVDVDQCYAMGANAYLCKPRSLERLLDLAKSTVQFWFEQALLPSKHA